MSMENVGRGFEDPLSCSTIAHRALLKKKWADRETGEISSAAYIPRLVGDEDGLSVSIRCSPEESVRQFRQHFGTASLHVGRVRDVDGLDIIEDPADHCHALIRGIPIPPADLARTEYLAGVLARQSRLIPVLPHPQ
jgi:hypothetical protein